MTDKDSDFAGLTDAEREALDYVDPDDTGDLDDDNDGADDADASAVDEAGDATGDGGPEDDSTPAGNVPEPATGEQPPTFAIPDLEAINQSLAQLREAREELETAYEAGDSDLTYAEHRAKLREIETAVLDLNAERAEALAVARMQQAFQQEWWAREIKSFKREARKADGVDYDQDKTLETAWDKAVKFLGADPDNAGQDAAWFLKEAHEMVKARYKLGKAPEVPPAQKRLSRVDEALAARRQRAGEVPKSLARLPEAAADPEGQTEFSHLDSLSGMALERALARLSPDQQERYLTQ